MNTLTNMFGRRSSSRTNDSGTGASPGDRKIPSKELEKVILLSFDVRYAKTTHKVMSKACKIPGVSSVALDGDCRITVTGTVDPQKLQNKLRV